MGRKAGGRKGAGACKAPRGEGDREEPGSPLEDRSAGRGTRRGESGFGRCRRGNASWRAPVRVGTVTRGWNAEDVAAVPAASAWLKLHPRGGRAGPAEPGEEPGARTRFETAASPEARRSTNPRESPRPGSTPGSRPSQPGTGGFVVFGSPRDSVTAHRIRKIAARTRPSAPVPARARQPSALPRRRPRPPPRSGSGGHTHPIAPPRHRREGAFRYGRASGVCPGGLGAPGEDGVLLQTMRRAAVRDADGRASPPLRATPVRGDVQPGGGGRLHGTRGRRFVSPGADRRRVTGGRARVDLSRWHRDRAGRRGGRVARPKHSGVVFSAAPREMLPILPRGRRHRERWETRRSAPCVRYRARPRGPVAGGRPGV